jgi:hypothetical protein
LFLARTPSVSLTLDCLPLARGRCPKGSGGSSLKID